MVWLFIGITSRCGSIARVVGLFRVVYCLPWDYFFLLWALTSSWTLACTMNDTGTWYDYGAKGISLNTVATRTGSIASY
jgi:hypothetical protein